ncbi:hypothetical protein D3C78_1616200 [compost metagenome]
MLGGRVKPHVRRRQETQHRADVDDAPGALLAHMRQHCLGGTQNAEQVGVEQRLGFSNRSLLRRAEQGHPRAVDQHVDAPGLGDDVLNALPDRRLVTDIHLD